ncbi:hypothetical protein PoB_003367700 [Plakobranchus ocellatus]|uniref:Uncharacterized protein n=1 Tax=Plakobranchus ocellatus TaxID=259542 RepID=A0AAV4AJJ3_9GAST|nr:hypothetical protein PoB_003367700 [Plakobranchus ocellatus]
MFWSACATDAPEKLQMSNVPRRTKRRPKTGRASNSSTKNALNCVLSWGLVECTVSQQLQTDLRLSSTSQGHGPGAARPGPKPYLSSA